MVYFSLYHNVKSEIVSLMKLPEMSVTIRIHKGKRSLMLLITFEN